MKVYIPESLVPILDTLTYHKEICQLCSIIYENMAFDDNDIPYPYTPLSSVALREQLGQHKFYPALREAEANNIVRCKDKGRKGYSNRPGEKNCKKYGICPPYNKDKMIRHTIGAPRKVVKKAQPKLFGIYSKLYKHIQRLTIEDITDEQISALLKKYPQSTLDRALICVDAIKEKSFRGSQGRNNNRFNSNLSNIKRELRPYLRVDGKPIIFLDMSCSQPSLLAYLFGILSPDILKNPNNSSNSYQYVCKIDITSFPPTVYDEIKSFQEECWSNTLYSNIATYLKYNSRNDAKEPLLEYLFGDHKKRHRVAKYFKAKYPTLDMLIEKLKEQVSIALMLQKFEAHIFINTIAQRLVDEYPDMPIYTIHDSIGTTDEYIEIVRRIMTEEVSKYIPEPLIK